MGWLLVFMFTDISWLLVNKYDLYDDDDLSFIRKIIQYVYFWIKITHILAGAAILQSVLDKQISSSHWIKLQDI